VFGGIILFVSRRFLLAGILMAAICVLSWVVVPVIRYIHYLFTDPSLERNRFRAMAVSGGLTLWVALLVGVLPFPSSFTAPGVLLSTRMTEVPARASGELVRLETPSTSTVAPGRPLVTLEDSEWEPAMRNERALKQHTLALRRRALREAGSDVDVINEHLELVEKRINRLRENRRDLTVTSSENGTWVAGALNELTGMRIEKGNVLGYVIDPERFRAVAVISQDEARWLFDKAGIRRGRLRLKGSAQEPLELRNWRVIPGEQRRLPSPALGWQGGGEVAVSPTDRQGVMAARSFFEVSAEVDPAGRDVVLLHGRTGRIRFRIAPEPLWRQAYRRIRQILSDD
jgi:putative peptide zinc metalloprotease protein